MKAIYYKLKKKNRVTISGNTEAEAESEGKINCSQPIVSRTRTLSTREVIEELTNECTLTPADIIGVLEALSGCVAKHLAEGNSVHLDGLGVFSISLTTKKNADISRSDSMEVTLKRITFKAEKQLKEKLTTCRFRADPMLKPAKETITDEELTVQIQDYLTQNNKTLFSRNDVEYATKVSRYHALGLLKRLAAQGILEKCEVAGIPVYRFAAQTTDRVTKTDVPNNIQQDKMQKKVAFTHNLLTLQANENNRHATLYENGPCGNHGRDFGHSMGG